MRASEATPNSERQPKRPQWFQSSPTSHEVVRSIMQYGPIARTPLAQLLGLSQGALSRITSDLIYAGVIEELPQESLAAASAHRLPQPADDRRRGRPQTALRLRSDQRTFVGISIHNTNVSAIAVDALCQPLTERMDESLGSTEPQAVAQQLASLYQRCRRGITPEPVGLGISLGGYVEDMRRVTYAPFLRWNQDVDLAGLVEAECGVPTEVFNDLDTLLLFENWFGHGVGIDRFAIVTIGIGIGYALSEHGRPIDYPDNSYGMAGHILVDPQGPTCPAGHQGCSYCLTDDSLAQEYSSLIGRTVGFQDFATDAVHGLPQARSLVSKTCFRLGAFLATMSNFAMPDKVFVSGESSFIAGMDTEAIRKGMDRYRPSKSSKVDVEILDFSWSIWARAAAAQAIASYV
ncbi:NagC family transcriptional regulator [Bifidobacterium aemilianum]|uniref:NagC family transcriptional regulator n=1 Tax=Bifidobacterium aemilianum TaxID=2493120 RepID=A0A366K630_9BIFI|nr:ROK family protein [Bifidobacterium aemilianum]RBP97195.1 NagC family transcriptional regulator [Bifidobacterium aemilianum]